MATFAGYNTDDGSQTPLAANGTVTLGPIETGVATRVAGSVYSDTAGTVVVYQTFMNPYSADGITLDTNTPWDIVQYPVTNGAVTGGTPVTIDLDVLAPYLKVKFTNGNSQQAHLRLFIRCFGVNRG